MNARRLTLALVTAIAVAAPAPALADDSSSRLTVMTRNLYVGSSFAHAITATTPEEFVLGVSRIWANVRQSDFRTRAQAIAAEVAAKRPDVIGLQEASLFRRVGEPEPALDYLQILRGALAARGLSYEVATVSTGFSVTAPAFEDGAQILLQLTDRDAILVKSGAPDLNITAAQSAAFAARVLQPTAVGNVPVPRTWNAVDGTFRGTPFRVVNTHLEPDYPAVQVDQARELLAGPLATTRPLVAIGDFNSRADGSGTASYGILTEEAGLLDAWQDGSGFTCCQAELLVNPISQLSERIDLVLAGNGVRPKGSELVGDRAKDRVAGLWPSDHAGVVAEVKLP